MRGKGTSPETLIQAEYYVYSITLDIKETEEA